MQFHCPVCRRVFDEAGFCPYDRAQLVIPAASPDKETLLSMAMPAAASPVTHDPPATQIEPRRGTLPLTPSHPTNEITTARARVQAEDPRFRVVSASDSSADALEAFRHGETTSEYDKLVGQTLDGRYFVEKKIGEGGMGVVFAARHAVIERPLAIKVLKREVMRDTATIRRFVQEAKAASRIGHPNIVDVTDFGTTPDGMTYSVMEFVVGQTLGSVLRHEAPFPPLRAIKIAAQIARALGAAHDKGIVHRDLKPENVFLVDRDGRTDFVKIVDFGIAKVAPTAGAAAEPRLTRAGSVFGTPEYMAPEQAAGRGDTDGRVDIYALGVILYEMVCGRVPHRGDSMVRTLAMQMLDPVEPPTKVRPDLRIPPELEAVILMALAKKREQRYQTMGQLLDALDKVHTVIGQSITGSPVYALAPLPPGADANAASELPATMSPPASRSVSPSEQPAAPRAKSPTARRARNEPEFVTSSDNKPRTFEHVWTETELPAPRRRWPLVLMALLILGGGAGAIVLVMQKRAATDAPPADARVAMLAPDAARVVEPVVDAAVVVEPAGDAAVAVAVDARIAAPADAEDIIVVDAPRVRPTRIDAGAGGTTTIPSTPNQRGTIMVQVLTKPEGAALYEGTSYRGPGGATLEEPLGRRLQIRCHQKGYKDGTVDIAFDGKTEVVLCSLKRIKICIDNIKNVFDDCEIDPNKPMP